MKLVNGTNVVYNALGLESQCVQPNEELNVTIEVKLPTTPGKYVLKFRLVHGDNNEFGDEVTVDLVAEAESEPVIEEVEEATPDEEQVCDDVKPIDYKLLTALEEPLTETNGDTFYVDQDQDIDGDGASIGDVDELNVSVDSWIMVDEEEAAAEPPGTTPDEDNEETPQASTPDNTATLSEDELQRNHYN